MRRTLAEGQRLKRSRLASPRSGRVASDVHLTISGDACKRQDWKSAPMELWCKVRDENPQEMAVWLDRKASFVPPHRICYGAPGSEPWRPVARCRECKQTHRWAGMPDQRSPRARPVTR